MYTVPIKSIRRSQVTSLLNLTKSHSGHTKNHQKSQKGSKNRKFSYKSPSKFPNIVNWRNHNFIRQVTGHTGWQIDLIATIITTIFYIPAWCYILFESLYSLRALPDDAYKIVDWTRFIPNFHSSWWHCNFLWHWQHVTMTSSSPHISLTWH